MISVMNKRDTLDGIRIDRSTLFGNPYPITDTQDRATVIALYEVYLIRQLAYKKGFYTCFMALVEQYKTTGMLTLVCWCSPLPCHGDVLAKYIKEYAIL